MDNQSALGYITASSHVEEDVISKDTGKEIIRVNEKIVAESVRVIAPDGEQLGIMTVPTAVERARGYGLDLVEVSPKTVPPVCRIMDFGKYKYEQTKRQQAARKKQVTTVLKEIKFRPKTDEHDYQFKLRHIREFLESKYKVKVVIFFRGREIIHKDKGLQILARVREETADLGTAVNEPKLDGRLMVMMMAPK